MKSYVVIFNEQTNKLIALTDNDNNDIDEGERGWVRHLIVLLHAVDILSTVRSAALGVMPEFKTTSGAHALHYIFQKQIGFL